MKKSKTEYGARVYRLGGRGMLLVKQIESDKKYGRYRVSSPYGHQRHVKWNDAAAIAQAIRDALTGKIPE